MITRIAFDEISASIPYPKSSSYRRDAFADNVCKDLNWEAVKWQEKIAKTLSKNS